MGSCPYLRFVLLGVIAMVVDWPKVCSKPLFSANYIFGDSTIDPGNNNGLVTIFKANFPPYGKDFPGRVATGRFTNGRLVSDMLAGFSGLPDIVPAYLDPAFVGPKLLTGCSFGSAAAGIDDSTSISVGALTLSKQFANFQSYRAKLWGMVGERNATNIIKNALFSIIIGTNDFGVNYFQNPFTRAIYTVEEFQDLLLLDLQPFIRDIYKEGATKFLVHGIAPLGCIPLVITLDNKLNNNCIKQYNDIAVSYNNKLQALIAAMKPTLPGLQLVYIDIYSKFLDIIKNPTKYGFDEVRRGCCGSGVFEVAELCNAFSKLCPNVSKHVFWDSVHPTNATYAIIAKDIFRQIRRKLKL